MHTEAVCRQKAWPQFMHWAKLLAASNYCVHCLNIVGMGDRADTNHVGAALSNRACSKMRRGRLLTALRVWVNQNGSRAPRSALYFNHGLFTPRVFATTGSFVTTGSHLAAG